jgi:murein L,D-transpeptidase YafK
MMACAGPSGESPPEAASNAAALEHAPKSEAPPPCDRVVGVDVWKAERAMVLTCARGAQVRWTTAIGREPRGTKMLTGDLRTPEGRYRIVGNLEPSRFHGFIPIDYPSPEDADRAVSDGRLSTADHARIAAAHQRGEMPPADTPLGGGIGIHGEGERWRGESESLDWTYGCLAITDAQLEFLAQRVSVGVMVEIHP